MAEPPHSKRLPSGCEPLGEGDSAERVATPPTSPDESPADLDLSSSELERISRTAAIDGPDVVRACPRSSSERSGDAFVDPRALFGHLIADRYRIVDLLAQGGMGAVYLAEHVELRSPVAMKLLQPQARRLPELVERFQREAVVGAHVKHPHIASATDFGALADGAYYLVLEFVEGKTLERVLKDGPLSTQRATTIASQIAEALSALHERGVVHRDVKPTNVMLLDRAGIARGNDFVKVIDFGLAKLDPNRLPVSDVDDAEPDARLTSAGVVVGTVAYMAPEAGQGMYAVDERSDLYALGVILYRMLAGQHPFVSRNDVDLFHKHVNVLPPPIAVRSPAVTISPELEAVVQKLLAKDPAERYQSAAEVVKALEPWTDRLGQEEPAPSPTTQARESGKTAPSGLSEIEPASRRQRSIMAARSIRALAVVGLAGAVTALLYFNLGHPAARSLAPETAPSATSSTSARASALPRSVSSSVVASASANRTKSRRVPNPIARAQFARAVHDQAWLMAFEAFQQLAKGDVGFFSTAHAKRDTESLFAALAHAQVPEANTMVDLLANGLGGDGHDVLIKVTMLRGGSRAHELASQVLGRPEVASQLAPAPAVALRLYQLGCEVSPQVYDEAVRIGDGRALTMLAIQRERCAHDEARHRAYRKLEKRLLAQQAAAAK